jgi:hypothetical protein
MNDSTLVDSWESGAKDGIQKYCQDLHVSASEELARENKIAQPIVPELSNQFSALAAKD